jgi:hypothetical protein
MTEQMAQYEPTIGGFMRPFSEGSWCYVRMSFSHSESVEFCSLMNPPNARDHRAGQDDTSKAST